MELIDFFKWCESTWPGEFVRQSFWLFPVIEAFHLVALGLFGGAVLMVDLRLLGVALRGQPLAEVARSASRWQLGGLVVLMVSGILLFLSEAMKCYYNQSYWVKMITLVIALFFTFTLRTKITSNGDSDTSTRTRLVAATSMLLWFTVAAAGRWIGFS